ncbi:hypothetical protein M8494_06720 [Serratia ureilytica]
MAVQAGKMGQNTAPQGVSFASEPDRGARQDWGETPANGAQAGAGFRA